MDSFPPSFDTAKFNTSAFLGNTTLTLEEADRRYLKISSGRNLYLIDGITPGIAQASKALIFDASINITNINSLTSTTLNTTSFNVSGNATYSGVNSTILFSGNSSLINMTGSASKITLTGNNTSIELTGTNGHIDFGNTAHSTNINTGVIRSAGGAYFGGDSIFNTKLKINGESTFTANLNINTSIKLYLDSASHNYLTSDTTSLVLDAGNNANPTNNILFRNTSLTTGALCSFQTSYVSKLNINNNSNVWGLATDSNDLSIGIGPYPNLMYFSNSSGCVGINTTSPNINFYLDSQGASRMLVLCVGDSTDATRLISCLNSTLTIGTANYITFGQENSSLNQGEMSFNYAGVSSTSNYIGFGLFGVGNILKIYGSGKIGINTGTNLSNQQLDINSSTGNNLRLLYNSTTSVVDLNVSSSGAFNIYPFNNETYIRPDNANGALYIGYNIASGSAGIMRFVHSGGVSYLQTGANNSSNSTSDFFIGSISQGTTSSNRKFMVKASGLVGIQSYNPTSQLEINASVGNNLKLTYNNSAGTATQYSTLNMGSAGTLTLTATGTTPLISLVNLVGINSSNPQKQLEINSATGACLQLSYNNSVGTATQYSTFAVSSIGGLTLTATGTTPTITLSNNVIITSNISLTGTPTINMTLQDLIIDNNTIAKKTIIRNTLATNQTLLQLTGGSSTLQGDIKFNFNNTAFGLDTGYTTIDSSSPTNFSGLALSTNGSYPLVYLSSTNNACQIGSGNNTTYSPTALLSCQSATFSPGVGSGYANVQEWGYKNQNPLVQLQASTTLNGDCYLGTYSNTNFALMTNNSNVFYINASGNCTIGGKTNTAPLYIATSVLGTVGAPGFLLSKLSSAATTYYAVGTTFASQSLSLVCTAGAYFGSYVYVISDRRLKKDIVDIDLERAYRFIKNISAKKYKYIKEDKNLFGFIAQDVVEQGFKELLNPIKNNDMEEGEDGISPKGVQWTLNYDSIPSLHHTVIKDLVNRVDELTESNNILTDESERQDEEIEKMDNLINDLIDSNNILTEESERQDEEIEKIEKLTARIIILENHIKNILTRIVYE